MTQITVQTIVQASLSKVWQCWTQSAHIINWNFASPDWYCPKAENNLLVGGEFHYTMAARDNTMSFDFWGTYTQVENEKRIEILLGDGRKMSVLFELSPSGVLVTEHFDPEDQNPTELQQTGWQMILDNFKDYTERS
jgi:uncharacterized protein YndB with AHSA1/START domain